jgi:hypothetical protein
MPHVDLTKWHRPVRDSTERTCGKRRIRLQIIWVKLRPWRLPQPRRPSTWEAHDLRGGSSLVKPVTWQSRCHSSLRRLSSGDGTSGGERRMQKSRTPCPATSSCRAANTGARGRSRSAVRASAPSRARTAWARPVACRRAEAKLHPTPERMRLLTRRRLVRESTGSLRSPPCLPLSSSWRALLRIGAVTTIRPMSHMKNRTVATTPSAP